MSPNEPTVAYAIPANYTDSGRLFGGMLETRNTIEAALLLLAVGYPEVMWLHIAIEWKVIVLTATLIPLGTLALMGIGGDSLTQYVGHVARYVLDRRKLHMRRIGRPRERRTPAVDPCRDCPHRPNRRRRGAREQKRQERRNDGNRANDE